MLRRIGWLAFVLGTCLLTSCQRVQPYRATAPEVRVETPTKDHDAEDWQLRRLSWTEQRERRDLPIVFVPSSNEAEWKHLPTFWNLPTGITTVHLGLPPLQALTAIILSEHHLAIKIKVPRGLPDPTPNIPTTNPPTHGKWRLGKKLFFERMLPVGDDYYSCATCHDPTKSFADANRRSIGGAFNTLSLINVVYNRRQFWDGRVETLEETVVRSLDDERPAIDKVSRDANKERALKQHIWSGFVKGLVDEKDRRYYADFDLVFGVEHPTQDTVAKALATYMRTILAGDSLYDRANEVRLRKKGPVLLADHFKAVLDEPGAKSLEDEDYSKKPTLDKMPDLLWDGHELFQGKARCAQCHQGPLFTDQDYHNIGYAGEEGAPPISGVETGRSAHVPVGRKEYRLVGAFRTPSLRNVSQTSPYFHNGSHLTLRDVVRFYDSGIIPTVHLARALHEGNHELRLRLSKDEGDALVMFLRSLQSAPVDPIVAAPPRP